MFNYFYKITNLLFDENGCQKFYLGIHTTKNLNDNYMGSGRYINNAIKSYGSENFFKTILAFYSTRKELLSVEIDVVDEDFLKRPDVYNEALGGGGWDSVNSLPRRATTQKERDTCRKHMIRLNELAKSTGRRLEHNRTISKLPKTEKFMDAARKTGRDNLKKAHALPRTEKQIESAKHLSKLPRTEKQLVASRKNGKSDTSRISAKRSTHVRWHVNRNEFNPDCEFCIIDFYSKQ